MSRNREQLIAVALALNNWQHKAERLLAEIEAAVELATDPHLEIDLHHEVGRVEDVGTGQVFQLSPRAMQAVKAQDDVLFRLGALSDADRAMVLRSQGDLLVYLVAADLV
jgi:hypothetical protein